MKKELKQVLVVAVFIIVGGIIGYAVATTQTGQLSDPEYIAFWTSKNMTVPEPIGYVRGVAGFGLLMGGIPTGLILFNHIIRKCLTPTAPKIIIGIIAFPIYTVIGVVCSIPFIVYNIIFSCLCKKNIYEIKAEKMTSMEDVYRKLLEQGFHVSIEDNSFVKVVTENYTIYGDDEMISLKNNKTKFETHCHPLSYDNVYETFMSYIENPKQFTGARFFMDNVLVTIILLVFALYILFICWIVDIFKL